MQLVQPERRLNSLQTLTDGLCPDGRVKGLNGNTINQPYTLADSNSYTPLTLNRILLSYSYMSQGLVQTVVRQPVDDAFRGGVTLKSPELDETELALWNASLKKSRKRDKNIRKLARKIAPNSGVTHGNSDIHVIKDVLTWKRLYGGAGLVINTNQDFSQELDIERINSESPLEFIAADRWELALNQIDVNDPRNPTPYNYYGLPLHQSRVVKVLGVEAPSYIRLRLQGWGMSEIERCIRQINSFCKFETVIFELIDEAKVDVFQIEGFNDALLNDEGTGNVQRRVMLANRLKNFQNALVMDAVDKYEQKQLTWSGLAELWNQFRLNLSSALKIPMNKLFGESATGFGGGEDAIENYNSIVQGLRDDADDLVTEVADLRAQQLFGFIPEYTVEWAPLKVLNGEEAEKVKASQQKRAMELFQTRLVTGREASTILRKDGLLTIETEVSQGLRDVEPTLPNEGDPSDKAMQAKATAQKSDKRAA